jgi:hypothetical protein
MHASDTSKRPVNQGLNADVPPGGGTSMSEPAGNALVALEMHSWRGFWRLRYRKYPQICEKALTELNERTSKPKPFDLGPGEYLRWCYETGLYMAGIRQTPPRRRPG